MKVVLELQDQMSNVRKITVRHDIVIGRGADCNLRLSAPQISRRHCFLRVGRDGVTVTDLDSSNGTWVEGRRIDSGVRCDVQDGNFLSLGPIRFLVHVRAEAVSSDLLANGVLNEEIASHTIATVSASPVCDDTTGAAAIDGHHTSGPRTTAAGQMRGGMLPLSIDSRAEIVDLGIRLAHRDDPSQIIGHALASTPSRETAHNSGHGNPTVRKSATLNPDSVDILQAGLLAPVISPGVSHNDTTSTDLHTGLPAGAPDLFQSPAAPHAENRNSDSAKGARPAKGSIDSEAHRENHMPNAPESHGIDPELQRFLSGF